MDTLDATLTRTLTMNEVSKKLTEAIESLHDTQSRLETAVHDGVLPERTLDYINRAIEYAYGVKYYVKHSSVE